MSPKVIVRKGTRGFGDSSPGEREFIALKDGEKVTLASLTNMEELLSIDQHAIWLDGGNSPMFPCIGEGCPGCERGNTPRFRAFLPVVTHPDGEAKIFAFGIKVARALEELDSEFGGLKGHLFTVKRKGTGLATNYTVIAVGRKAETDSVIAPNVEEKLGPTTRAGIMLLLQETGAIEATEGAKAAAPVPAAAKKEGEEGWSAV